MVILLMTIGWLAVLSILLPILKKEVWWIRVFDFPRAQVTAIAGIVLIAFFNWREPQNIYHTIFLGMLTVAILYQLVLILPYTPIWKKQVRTSNQSESNSRISILVSNILMRNRDGQAFQKLVIEARPDILLLLEADDWWAQELESLKKYFPYQVTHPLDNTYGILLYSKLELRGCSLQYLVEDDIPSIHGKVVLRTGEEVQLHCVHPRPPGHGHRPGTIPRDAELLLVGREVRKSDLPAIVMGDFNDVAWSYTTMLLQKISGLLDPRIGRGLFSTFPARLPFLRFPLDHVFHSGEFRLVEYRRLGYIGSDHLPLLCILDYCPAKSDDQKEVLAGRAHHAEAARKIRIADPIETPDI